MLGSALIFGRPGAFHVVRARNGLPAGVSAALIAHDGTIWIGAADGLYRFMYPFRLEFWDQQDGVDAPYSLLQKGSSVYASSNGIYHLDADRELWRQLPNANAMGTVVSLLDGPANTFDAAALVVGVMRLTSDGRILAKTKPGPGGASLVRDGAGNVWLGGTGISRIVRRGSDLTMEDPIDAQQIVLNVFLDKSTGRLWACDPNQIFTRLEGAWTKLDTRGGLLHDFCQSIAASQSGDVWVGYGGLAAFSLIEHPGTPEQSIRHFRSGEDDVGGAKVSFLSVDRRGWLWRGSDADYVATETMARDGKWIRLDAQDGIPVPGGNQNSFYTSPDGSIWFASGNTVVHFSPASSFATAFAPPAVFVSGFSTSAAHSDLQSAGADKFPYSDEITAHIGCLQFDRRNAIRLRWRILPGEHAWQEAKGFDLVLARLHWGPHTLEVQARLGTGAWSSTVSESFTIATPWAFTWPALSTFALVGIACGTGTSHWQRRRKQARQKLNRAFPDLSEWRLTALSPEMAQLDGEPLGGRFEAGRVLARGGFAAVAEGRDLADGGRRCAVKIFRQEVAQREWIERRFQQEVRALSEVDHPNVVRIIGSGILPQGTMYLAMDFIEGLTLREKLGNGRLPPAEVAAYVRQMGSALEAIHARGICHRDLKPENLMLRSGAPPGEEVVLIDFSIAIVKDPDETVHGLSRAAGTISYMAPEQAIGYADPATDIYSLAKIVIEMLTGERLNLLLPTASMDLPARSREMMREWGFPPDAESLDLLEAALQFDPARRPKDAGQFADRIASDLERLG